MLHDLGFDNLSILLTVPLSLVFRPNERPPSINFKKDRWDDLDFYFNFHRPFTKKYLSLSCAGAFFTLLTLNAVKLFIPFNCVNLKPRGLLKWKMRSEKDERLLLPLIEVMKIVRLTSLLPDKHRLFLSKPRLRHGRRPAFLFSKSNSKSMYSFLCSVVGFSYLFSFSSNFPTVPLPASRLWSSLTA